MIKSILILRLTIITFISSFLYSESETANSFSKIYNDRFQVKKNHVKATVSSFKNKTYTLIVKSYLDTQNESKLHCVTNQYLIFKKGNKTISVKKPYLIDRTLDKKYVKYIVTDVAPDVYNKIELFNIKFYAANGEPEYSFVYKFDGTLLFCQKCIKAGCNIKMVTKSYLDLSKYLNSRKVKFQEVNNICY